MIRVLLIGGLSGGFGALARDITLAGGRVTQVDHATAGLAHLRRDAGAALVLCDIAQDIGTLSRAMLAERISVKLVAVADAPTPQQAEAAMRAGARDVVGLPVDTDLLAALLAAASGAPGTPIVRDPVMLAVTRRAEQIARSDATVLITGESGTGKEVLARLIHRNSRRMSGPFVALNCAAIPEHLLESELFGHEKGAFSGALARRIGKFEAAEGGTLLLDEISEMELRLQAKLLRAIQEREIDRVGGNAPVRVDVRILATSNRDLAAEAAAGRFREDLFFRLNVVGLRIPPLRERPGDIAALADHFASHFAGINGLPPRPLSRAAMLMLGAHHWRGTVRELETILHRAVLLATGNDIGVDAIELQGGPPRPAHSNGAAAGNGEAFVGRRMEDVERDLILDTLSHTRGNRTHAATMLGMSIRALRNKLKDYAQAGIAVTPPQAGAAA
jgi:DNA-binding NtrC family response regulator